MKNIKIERKSSSETGGNNVILCLTKGAIVSYLITALIFIIYGIILTYTQATEKNMQIVVMSATVISTFISGFIVSKNVNSKGLIFGMISGVLYSLLMILIAFCVLPVLKLNFKIIMIFILSLCSGGVGGIIGVNIKK